MKKTLPLLLTASTLLVSGCFNLDKLKRQDLNHKDYNDELAKNYMYFSDSEAKKFDWKDSDYFAQKGLDARVGKMIMPENPEDYKIGNMAVKEELMKAREQLMFLLTDEVKTKHPVELAAAMRYYDCWVAEAEEDQKMELAECKGMYLGSVEALRSSMYGHNSHHVSVFFNLNSATISKKFDHYLKHVAWMVNRPGAHHDEILVQGYADTTGTPSANAKISKKRAMAIVKKLESYGVPASKIKVQYHGENHLQYPTVDQILKRSNRRATVDVR